MQTTIAPGPWRAEISKDDVSGGYDIRSADNYYVAMTCGGFLGGKEQRHAALLAAAPRLLAELRRIDPDNAVLLGLENCL